MTNIPVRLAILIQSVMKNFGGVVGLLIRDELQ